MSASAQHDRPFAEKGDLALVATVSGDIPRLNPAFGGVGLRYRVADRTVLGASVGGQYDTSEDESANESAGRRFSVALWNENHIGRRRGDECGRREAKRPEAEGVQHRGVRDVVLRNAAFARQVPAIAAPAPRRYVAAPRR